MSLIRQFRESSTTERGSAIAEFVFVSMLLTLVAAAIFQLGFALHARNTIIDAAGEGARVAALHGSTMSAGVARTRHLVNASLPTDYATDITARLTELHGVPVVEVTVRSRLPLFGFLGPQVVTSTGRAMLE